LGPSFCCAAGIFGNGITTELSEQIARPWPVHWPLARQKRSYGGQDYPKQIKKLLPLGVIF
jgi:hypothetical protein